MKKTIWMSFLLITAISLTAGNLAKPRGYWKLDEGSGAEIKDCSGNGFPAEAESCEWTKCGSRNVLKFTGSKSFMQLKSGTVDQKLLKNGTVTFWFKLDKAVNARLMQFTDYLIVDYQYPANYLAVTAVNGNGKIVRDRIARPKTGKWYFFAVSWSETGIAAYLDGNEKMKSPLDKGLLSASSKMSSKTQNVYFGAMRHSRKGFMRHLDGCLADIRYFSATLTPSEIREIYNSEVKTFSETSKADSAAMPKPAPVKKRKTTVKKIKKYPPVGLVGYWNFNEGRGNVVHDRAGWIGNMTAHGNPKWIKNNSGYCLEFDGKPGGNAVYLKLARLGYFNQMMASGSPMIERGAISLWAKPVDGGFVPDPEKRNQGWLFFWSIIIEKDKWRTLVNDPEMMAITFMYGPKVQSGRWNHIVLSWNEEIVRLYVNGKLIRQPGGEVVINTQKMMNLKSPFYVGVMYPWVKWGWYKGYMDEIKYFSCPLSPEQVKKEYETGLAKVKI